MKVKSIWAFFQLIRIKYSLWGALGVFISGFLTINPQIFQLDYLIAFLVVFFSAIGSFALNDYYDFKNDQRNNRLDRPFVLGLLSRKLALITGVSSFFSVIFFSLFLNSFAMLFVLISLPIFYLYNLKLKKLFLIKNIVIAYAFVAIILLGSLVSNTFFESLILYFSFMGFIVGLAYEIMLDIGDLKGDRLLGIDTISTRFGSRIAAYVSVILYVSIIFLDPLPFFIMIDPRLYFDYVFLLIILVPVVSYIYTVKSLIQNQSKKNIFKLKKQVFVIMQIGTLAYLMGVLL